jgi:tripartite-type tricarboxylate transporter receptor subunit TctC
MIRVSRRTVLAAPALLGVPLPDAPAYAQGVLPARGVRIVIGYPVGGGTDEMARVIAGSLQRRLSRPVTIENRPSASGAAVGEILKRAPTDGSVLGFMQTAALIGRLTDKSFPFNPLTDVLPLTLAGTYPTAFAVSRKVEVTTLAGYGKWLGDNTRPEDSRFGTTSLNTLIHLFGLMIGQALNRPLEAVYFKGASPLVTDLQEGRIPAGSGGLTSFLQHHRGSRLRILVTSDKTRSKMAPDIPTVAELGYPSLELQNWYGFFGPAGLSPEVAAAWERELRVVLDSRDVTEQLSQLGLDVQTSTSKECAERLAADVGRWRSLLDTFGLKETN